MGFMSDSAAGKIAILAVAIVLIGGLIAGFIFMEDTSTGRAFFNNGFTGVFNSIVRFVEAPFYGFVDLINKAINYIISYIQNAITGIGKDITGGITGGITQTGKDISSGASGIWSSITNFFGGL